MISIEVENEDDISQNGRICVFSIPESIKGFDKFRISIKAVKHGNKHKRPSFLVEPVYDLILDNNQKFLTLESGLGFGDKKRQEVQVRVYKNNKLSLEERVELILKSENNEDSPTVGGVPLMPVQLMELPLVILKHFTWRIIRREYKIQF